MKFDDCTFLKLKDWLRGSKDMAFLSLTKTSSALLLTNIFVWIDLASYNGKIFELSLMGGIQL